MSVKTTILYINISAACTSSILNIFRKFYPQWATSFLQLKAFLANSFLHSFSWFFVPVTRSVLTQDPQFCVPQNCYVSFVPVAHSVLTQDPQFWNAKLLCFLRSCSTFCTNAGPSVLKRKTVMFPSVLQHVLCYRRTLSFVSQNWNSPNTGPTYPIKLHKNKFG